MFKVYGNSISALLNLFNCWASLNEVMMLIPETSLLLFVLCFFSQNATVLITSMVFCNYLFVS